MKNSDIIEELKGFKEKSGWSNEKIAREIGVSLLTVFNWFSGKFKPSLLARERIKKFLDKYAIEGGK